MSKIKVNSLEGVGASTPAISIDNASGTCTANITNNLSNRNLIINGAMQIAQRGTSDTTLLTRTVDRFFMDNFAHGATNTQSQGDVAAGTTPYSLGFRKSYKFTLGNNGTPATSTRMAFSYKIEAQDIANSGWNYTSSSSYITISYWVKSSVSQNFYFRFKTSDGTAQAYAAETGTLTADTWTKITKQISGNSNLTFNNDNGEGLEITFDMYRGTDRTGTMSLNAWAASDFNTQTPDQTATFYSTNGATFEITGVQLEVDHTGSGKPTDFEHRSFGQEFALCQRYYQQYTNIMSVGYVPNNSSKSYSHGFHFPVEMRAAPTTTIANTGSTAGQYVTDGETNRNVSSLNSAATSTSMFEYYFNLTGDLTDYRGAYAVATTSTTHQTTYYITAEL